jgi:hypothetical protein
MRVESAAPILSIPVPTVTRPARCATRPLRPLPGSSGPTRTSTPSWRRSPLIQFIGARKGFAGKLKLSPGRLVLTAEGGGWCGWSPALASFGDGFHRHRFPSRHRRRLAARCLPIPSRTQTVSGYATPRLELAVGLTAGDQPSLSSSQQTHIGAGRRAFPCLVVDHF